MATVTSLAFRINSIYNGDGMRQARRDMSNLDSSMNALSKSSKALVPGMSDVVATILGLGPALVPIAGGLLGVGAAAGSAMVAAGAAVGVFGFALKGAIQQTIGVGSAFKDTNNAVDKARAALDDATPGTKAYTKANKTLTEALKEHENVLKAMPPVQEKFARTFEGSKMAMQGFNAANAKFTLGPATTALETFIAALPELSTVVRAMAPEVQRVANLLKAWVTDGGLDRFIKFIKSYGVPAFHGFVDALRLLFGALGKGMRDTAPLGPAFIAWLTKAMAAFKSWADGGGFQRFLAWLAANKGQLIAAAKDLGTFLANIGKSLSNMSGASFTVLGVFLKVLASFPPGVLTAMAYGFIVLRTAIFAYNVVAFVSAAASSAMLLWLSPMGPLLLGIAASALIWIAALAAIGVAIYFLVKYWDQVWNAIKVAAFAVWNALKTAWSATWNKIKSVALAIWSWLSEGWHKYILLLLGPLGVIAFIAMNWEKIWGTVKSVASGVWTWLQNAWAAFTGWFVDRMNTVLAPVLKFWRTVWPEAQRAAANVWNILKVLWGGMLAGLSAAWNAFWGVFGPAFKSSWSGASTAAKAVWAGLSNAWDVLWSAMTGIFNVGKAVITAAWNVLWSVLTNSAKVAWSALSGAWSVLWTVIKAVWNVFASTFGAFFSGLWNVVVTMATGAWNIIKAAWSFLWKTITAIFLVFFAIFTLHWGKAWNAIKDAGMAFWNLLTVAWQSFVNYVMSIFNLFKGVLLAAWGALWTGLKDIGLAAWGAFQNTLGTAIAGFKAVWNTAWGGMKDVWNTLWAAIVTTGTLAYEKVIKPIADGFMWLYNILIGTVVPAIVNGVVAWFNLMISPVVAAVTLLSTLLSAAWGAIFAALQFVWNALQTAWNFLWSQILAIFTAAWTVFSAVFQAGWTAVVAIARLVWESLKADWSQLWTAVQAIWNTFWTILQTAWNVAWGSLTIAAKSAWALLQSAWNALWATITGIWNLFYTTFSVIFSAVWTTIVTLATGIWNALKAAWSALWAAVQAVWAAYVAMFTAAWTAAWNAIRTAAQAVWNAIKAAWSALWTALQAAWAAYSAAFRAAWQAFWTAVQAAAAAVWAAFRAAFQAFLTAVQAAWTTAWNAVRAALTAALAALQAAAAAAWSAMRTALSAFLSAVRAAWDAAWTAVRTFFQTAVNAVVAAANAFWAAIRFAFSAGSTWLRETFWNPVANFFTKTIPSAFDAGAKALGKAWDSIRKLVRDPIQAVVNVVYNNGIVKLWNAIAGVFGAKKLDSFSLPAFKKGGPTGSGSADGFPALVHPGEHVWTKDEVRGAGGHGAVAALRSQAMGGAKVRVMGDEHAFKDGGGILGTGIGPDAGPDLVPDGIIDNIGGAIGSAVGKLKDLALGAISGPFGAAVDAVASLGKKAVRAAVPGTDLPLEQLGVGMVDQIAETVKSWVEANDVAEVGGNGFVPWKKWQEGDGTHVNYRGVTVNRRTAAMLNNAAKLAKTTLSMFQGSYSNSVGASAGTHSGGGAADVGPAKDSIVGAMRASGFAAWRRTPAEGFSPHVHGIAVGDPTASAAAKQQVKAFQAGKNGLANNGPDTYNGGGTSGKSVSAAQATGKSMNSARGWSKYWSDLKALWTRESGWRWNADNPSSSAYGIPQALPGSKMKSAGADWKTNPATQIKWGLGYIASRYGNPGKANSFQKSHNWYGLGTPGASRGPAVVGEHEPEVINLRGGERIDPLSDLIGRGGGDTNVTVTIPISGRADHGVVDRLERETIPKLTMAIKQGVGRRT